MDPEHVWACEVAKRDGQIDRLRTALRNLCEAGDLCLDKLESLVKAEVDSIPGAKDIIYDPAREELCTALAHARQVLGEEAEK